MHGYLSELGTRQRQRATTRQLNRIQKIFRSWSFNLSQQIDTKCNNWQLCDLKTWSHVVAVVLSRALPCYILQYLLHRLFLCVFQVATLHHPLHPLSPAPFAGIPIYTVQYHLTNTYYSVIMGSVNWNANSKSFSNFRQQLYRTDKVQNRSNVPFN